MSLIDTPQWLPVLLAPRADGRTDKIPVNHATGMPCNAHEPANWTTYDAARALAAAWGSTYTVGFVLTAVDDYFCVDIDGALQADGTWSPLSQRLVAALPGCMVEVSQSGRGLHIWGRYPSPPPHISKRIDLHIECYTTGRFIAIGTRQTGAIADRCDAFPAFLAEWFPPRAAAAASHGSGPRADWRGPADDTELLRRAMQSRSTAAVFGGRASFADLWLADADVLRAAYPGDGDHAYDASSADAALAQHLAFWTGCDADRMVALMQQSKLRRDKYDREDYLPRNVANACSLQREVLQDKPDPVSPVAATDAPAVTMTDRGDATILHPDQYAKMFENCFYVVDHHKVLLPGGKLYKPDQFRAVKGGYTFIMDRANSRTTRNAFEAFTESQAMRAPKADGTRFDPLKPYGHVIDLEGRTLVNTWWPPEVKRVKGDISPFLDHLTRLLPDAQDRDKFLYYLANMVQRPGHKFQFAPLIIGAEGNGKTFFSRCVAQALGTRYAHWPRPDQLGKQFNAWMVGKLAYLVEDAYIGGNLALLEKLKPMITGEAIEVEGKGVDQRASEVCGNWIFNANHRDAIRKTVNDRRYMVLWCAQQTAKEVESSGMGGTYFERLYGWAKDRDGYAAVAEYLHTVVIPPEYGLQWVMGRAPATSSTANAIEATRTRIEEAIIEAIDQEEVGFRGGWISSHFLSATLSKVRQQDHVPRSQYSSILEPIGYVPHPALDANKGQVHNPVLPDGKKSKLFVRRDSEAFHIARGAEVAAAYQRAQTSATFSPLPFVGLSPSAGA